MPKLMKSDFFVLKKVLIKTETFFDVYVCTHSDVQELLLFPWIEKQAGNSSSFF